MALQCLLLAADEPAALLRGDLEANGVWSVTVASSAQDGLALAEANQPDAILLAGTQAEALAVLPLLRGHDATKGLPVFLLTASREETDPTPDGLAAVLAQPVQPAMLPLQLRDAFEATSFRSALGRLNRLGGEPFIRKLIALFLEAGPRRVHETQAGLKDGDLAAIERAVHSLQSNAGNMGAATTRKLAQRIEQLAEAKQGEALPALINELAESLDRFIQRLQQWKERSDEANRGG